MALAASGTQFESINEPTGPELAELLRDRFPEMDAAEFYEDVDWVSGTRCGVLMAFAIQVNAWVRAGKVEPIRRALALIDQMVAEAPPVTAGTGPEAVGDQFHNSLLACFVEDVVNGTRESRALVVPNLGPAVLDFLQQHQPHKL